MSAPSRESSIAEAKAMGMKYHDDKWVDAKRHMAKKMSPEDKSRRRHRAKLGKELKGLRPGWSVK